MAALGFGATLPDIILDIKPGSCPNSVALLGGADFDVRDVDVSTFMLAGVPILKYSYEDVAVPCDGGCCMGDDYDGYDDLNLKFDTSDTIVLCGKPNWRWSRERAKNTERAQSIRRRNY